MTGQSFVLSFLRGHTRSAGPAWAALLSLVLLAALPAQAKTRNVTITSQPAGAQVNINGRVVGTTPVSVAYDNSFFDGHGSFLWSKYLNEPIVLNLSKEGCSQQTQTLTGGPYTWQNGDGSAVHYYYTFLSDHFNFSLDCGEKPSAPATPSATPAAIAALSVSPLPSAPVAAAFAMQLGPAPAAQQAAPSRPPADGPSLGDTMKFIADKLSGLGPVNFIANVTAGTSTNPATFRFTQTWSNVSIDSNTCHIGYHSGAAVNGAAASGSSDAEVWAWQIEKVQVMPADQFFGLGAAKAGHPEWSTQVQPPVSILRAQLPGSGFVAFAFYDAALADRVAKALTHAVELCGGGNKDPF